MTIKSTPPSYCSVNDKLTWVVYDANSIDTSKLNYKYWCEVWINGTKVHQSFSYPYPGNSFGVFEMSGIIREYVKPIFSPTTNLVSQILTNGEFTIEVTMKFFETYVVGTTQTTSATTSDTARVFFNHYNGIIDSFTKLDTFSDKPATTRDKVIDMVMSSEYYLIPYFAETTAPFDIKVAGLTKTITPAVANSMYIINISPTAITNEFGGSLPDLSGGYSISINNVSFNIIPYCEPLSKNYTVHFLSQYGGFETFNFEKVSKNKFAIDKKTYRQDSIRIDDTTGVVSVKTGNVMHQQTTTFGVSVTNTMQLNTDNLSDSNHDWLAQLMMSPIVYLENNGTFYPINISKTNYDPKQYLVDGLNNVTIDIDLPSSFNTQFS